jgi:glycosyltransferase involved in cell wall biosynthesis
MDLDQMSVVEVCIDVAGAASGGAARFRAELLDYLANRIESQVRVIGLGRPLTAAWILRREAIAGRSTRLAVNNVSYVGPGRKTVLLRNPLHFLRPAERSNPQYRLPGMAAQARVVHLACRHADLLVTPTNDMADRVTALLPGVASRIEVRAHPLTFRSTGRTPANVPEAPFILSPALSSPHKAAAVYLRRLSKALTNLGRDELVAVTLGGSELPGDLQADPRIWPIGQQDLADMPEWYSRSSAIYFPTSVESFGYPLAEARASGRTVIAIDSELNREVAGCMLCGYVETDEDSFERAVAEALKSPGPMRDPDPVPFDAANYFDWLLTRATCG